MIDVALKIYEAKGGLQVRVTAVGRADSERCEVYARELQAAIKQALLVAGEKVAAAGLGGPLTPEFKAAVAGTVAKLQLDQKAPSAQPHARPPMFSEWRDQMIGTLEEMARAENAKGNYVGGAALEDAVRQVTAAASDFLKEMVSWNRQRAAELERGGS